MVTVLHMILSALWPEESFNACWQVLWDTFVSWFPQFQGKSPSRRRVADARARLPLARLVTVCLARTMTILDYAIGGYRQGEWSLLSSILGSLNQGDLLIGDRHFAGAPYYVFYQNHGLEFLTRAHHRLKIARVKRIVRHSSADFIGRLNLGKLHRRKDPSLPTHIDVRFLRATLRIRGRRQSVWFVTSLLDPKRYPPEQVIALYACRWRVETLLREVKITLSADVLRSQSPEGIRKEIVARLTALNVVRTLMLEAAAAGGIQDPLRISFVHAIRAILSFSSALGHAPLVAIPGIYQALLTEIASHLNPDRPNRLEPRAVRRDRKHYPSLRVARAQWKARHHAASPFGTATYFQPSLSPFARHGGPAGAGTHIPDSRYHIPDSPASQNLEIRISTAPARRRSGNPTPAWREPLWSYGMALSLSGILFRNSLDSPQRTVVYRVRPLGRRPTVEGHRLSEGSQA